MNLSYSLILAFVGIAGPTSAGPTSAGPTSDEPTSRPTSAFMPFENNLKTVRAEVIKYCDDPTEYDKTSLKESVYGPIKDWDVSALTSMYGLFSPDTCPSCPFCLSCITCNPPVSNWNVSAVITFNSMFRGARGFNQDLRKWGVGKGHSFESMFHGASEFNQDLSKWDVRKGLDFNAMFYGATVFNQDLSKWGVGKGHSFKLMFRHSGMSHYIGGWDMSALSQDKNQDQLTSFSQMIVKLPASNITSFSMDEWHQFNNLVTPVKLICE